MWIAAGLKFEGSLTICWRWIGADSHRWVVLYRALYQSAESSCMLTSWTDHDVDSSSRIFTNIASRTISFKFIDSFPRNINRCVVAPRCRDAWIRSWCRMPAYRNSDHNELVKSNYSVITSIEITLTRCPSISFSQILAHHSYSLYLNILLSTSAFRVRTSVSMRLKSSFWAPDDDIWFFWTDGFQSTPSSRQLYRSYESVSRSQLCCLRLRSIRSFECQLLLLTAEKCIVILYLTFSWSPCSCWILLKYSK